jgi:hypothetical protein
MDFTDYVMDVTDVMDVMDVCRDTASLHNSIKFVIGQASEHQKIHPFIHTHICTMD